MLQTVTRKDHLGSPENESNISIGKIEDMAKNRNARHEARNERKLNQNKDLHRSQRTTHNAQRTMNDERAPEQARSPACGRK
jgi:hypothetical protein